MQNSAPARCLVSAFSEPTHGEPSVYVECHRLSLFVNSIKRLRSEIQWWAPLSKPSEILAERNNSGVYDVENKRLSS